MPRIRDIIFSCFLLVVVFLLYRESKTFFVRPGMDASPALWPQIVLGLLAILSLALIVISLKEHLKVKKETSEKIINFKIKFSSLLALINWKVIGALAVTWAFLLVFRPLGFAITSFIYFIVITMILEPTKNIKKIAFRTTQAVTLVILMYFVFVRALKVQLPLGPLDQLFF